MSADARAGRSDAPSQVPAAVWLRRWQVEEERLIVRVDDAVDWKCVRPSDEAVAWAAAAGVALTAELDSDADGIASSVFRDVRGVVTGVREVRVEGGSPVLVPREAVSIRDAISIATAPGFIVTVRPPATGASDVLPAGA